MTIFQQYHSSVPVSADALCVCMQDATQPTAVGACVVNASIQGRISFRSSVTHGHLLKDVQKVRL